MRRARGVAIRPGENADVDALVAIEAVFPTDRLDRRGFRHAIRSPSIDLVVADRDGIVIGYAAIHRRRRSSLAHLASIAVEPEAAGQGIGQGLLRAAEAAALRNGCTRLCLEVRADNEAARRLYDGAGYRRVGILDDYYEDGAAAWRYEKELGETATVPNPPSRRSPRPRP